MNQYYQHSGNVGLMGPVYMLSFGAVGAAILGAIYGYAIFYIPFIYLNFFITLGFGGVVGFLVGLGGKLGKVRNSKIMVLFGLVIGLFAEYTGWVAWVYAFLEQETLVLNPSQLLHVINLVSQNGAWSIFGWTPTGIAIDIIWLIEALMIIGMSIIAAWGTLSSTPFCETCRQWIEQKELLQPLTPIEDTEKLKSDLARGEYESLITLNATESKKNAYTQIELTHCPTCQQKHFMTVKSVTISYDSDSKEKKDEHQLVENLIISRERFTMLKSHW